MTQVTVRMYHVGFGDCFLVTAPGATRPYRLLFDCGRLNGSRPPKEGEPDFGQIVQRLLDDVTDADGVARLDVVVVTHRHRDHVHGFSFGELWRSVEVGEVWLPWVEDRDDPVADRLREGQERSARRAFHALRALRAASGSRAVDDAIEIAYNSTTNAEAFATISEFAERGARMRYLPREGRRSDRLTREDFGDLLPAELTVHVLGPSRDPRVIKRLNPPKGAGYLALMPAGADPSRGIDPASDESIGSVPRPFPAEFELDPEQARELYDIDTDQLDSMCDAAAGNPLELVYRLDNAVNGTSLVLLLELGALRLLFSGDAQWGTWDDILNQRPAEAELLEGLSFYKVGHHGSHNATPRAFVERYLATDTEKLAMVSVAPTKYRGGWQEIPRPGLLDALAMSRTRVLRSDEPTEPDATVAVEPGYYTEITLSDE